jgi:uncharacterized membrane protein
MNRLAAFRTLPVAFPLGAVATIVVALLWTIGAIPRVPIASEVIGLFAVLLAPGIAVEPSFHGDRWTLVERLGLAAALSLALAGLLGLGLHVAGLPVSPTNVLILLLVVAVLVGAHSIRFRKGRSTKVATSAMRLEIGVGLGSLALLAAGFASIIFLNPAPEGPRLEIMAVDDAGRLLTMPIHLSNGNTTVMVGIRSESGDVTSASVAVEGAGVRPWSASGVEIGAGWTAVEVPIEATARGTVVAHVTVKGDGAELTLPIAMAVGP